MTNEILERPSGVNGLLIWGSVRRGGYQIHTKIADTNGGDPKQLPVFERDRAGITLNSFDRVRDAKAAAARLAGFLPWNDPTAVRDYIRGLTPDGRREFQVAMAERLTGRPIAELDAEQASRSAARQALADGTGPRDAYDADLTAAGHAVTWERKGQRTFWGKCSRCHGQFRSSYSSHSRGYNQTSSVGYGYPMPACAGEPKEQA